MGGVCGIPVPEHKVNISVNIPEIVKQIEKEVIEKVELKVKDDKLDNKITPVEPIESYIKRCELYQI